MSRPAISKISCAPLLFSERDHRGVGGVGVFRNWFRSPAIEQVLRQIEPWKISRNAGHSIRIQLIQSIQRKDLDAGERVEPFGGNFCMEGLHRRPGACVAIAKWIGDRCETRRIRALGRGGHQTNIIDRPAGDSHGSDAFCRDGCAYDAGLHPQQSIVRKDST